MRSILSDDYDLVDRMRDAMLIARIDLAVSQQKYNDAEFCYLAAVSSLNKKVTEMVYVD